MIDIKTAFRTTLINSVALTALVPAARITQAWPKKDSPLPCIVFKEYDNFVTDIDYDDDTSKTEQSLMQIDIFCTPGTSTTSIAQAVDTALSTDLWNRDYSEDFVDPDSYIVHRVMRYSKRVGY